MTDLNRARSDLHARLDRRRIRRAWGKVEIFLGLTAAGLGLFLGDGWLGGGTHEIDWMRLGTGLALFVLGGYLALAGHRGHLYVWSDEQVSFLADVITKTNDQGTHS
jgi:hypothetical protein